MSVRRAATDSTGYQLSLVPSTGDLCIPADAINAPHGVATFGRMNQVTVFGALAVSFMMVMYALERRHRLFILAFAFGCLLSSAYGFLSGAWPFGVVEVVWSGVAIRRFLSHSREPPAAERC